MPVPVEARSGKIISDQHGELTAVVTILHDHTEALERERLYGELKLASSELERKVREATAELVRQNELLRRQAIELEQASALKSQFLANMSHEFRTPLNAILGYTSMLLKGVLGALTPEHDNLARVDSNSRHLLAHHQRHPRHLPHRGRAHAAPRHAVPARRARSPRSWPSSSRSSPSPTWPSPTALDPRLPPMRSDRQKVKQIILNLLTNAVKFTPHGAVKVSAMPSLDPPADRDRRRRHRDRASPPATRPRIFEDFQQADNSPTRTYGGAGLGLSICNRLVIMLAATSTSRASSVRARRSRWCSPPGRR